MNRTALVSLLIVAGILSCVAYLAAHNRPWLFRSVDTPGASAPAAIPTTTPIPGVNLPLDAPCFAEQALASKNYVVAYQSFLHRSAKDPVARFYLGVMFRDGLGVLRNPQMAIDRFLQAAAMGDRQAMAALGWMFSGDRDTGHNYAEAFRWYERAALLGEPVAQFHLADMYLHGNGTKADKVRAYAWFSMIGDAPVASDEVTPIRGDLPVADALHKTYQELTRDELAQANRLVGTIKKKMAAPTAAAAQAKEAPSCVP